MNKFFTLALMLSVILSCGDLTNTSKENLTEADLDEIKVDDLFRLSLPKYMKVMHNLNEEASLQYANIYKEVYTVVIYESKEEFVSVFKELEEYDDELSILENYKITQQNFFKEIAVIDKIEPYKLKKINGLKAKQIKILANVDGIDIAYVITYIEGREHIFQIMTWTLPSSINKYEDTFLKINNSFKLLKK